MIEPRPHIPGLFRDVERGARRADYVRLDRNERVSPMSEEQRRELFASLHPDVLNAYPDPSPLYERLSTHLGVPEECLFVTSGSDTAIRRIFEAFVRPGDRVIQPDPSYAMYQVYTTMFEAEAQLVPYGSDRKLPIDLLLLGLDQRPRVLFVANPDQPTGTALEPDVLRRLAAASRDRDVLMVIDEAYHPFHPRSAMNWRAEYDNVVVIRTFSKVGGLAGLRIGYLVGAPQVVDWIQRTRGSFEVNSVAIAVACWEMDHPEIQEQHVAEVEAGRAVLRTAAEGMGLGFPECETNFQLLRFSDTVNLKEVVNALKAEGFLIKGPFDTPALSGCPRVSLGGPVVMHAFSDALGRVLSKSGAM